METRAFERVHVNPSMTTIKSLTKIGPLRFAIDHADNLHVGDAHKYTHGGHEATNLHNAASWDTPDKVHGFIDHNHWQVPGKHSFIAWHAKTKGKVQHQKLDLFKEAGIEDRVFDKISI